MSKILTLLAKLKQHQESAKQLGSEAEAQAFAEKIQRLLTEHKLSMTDVEYATLDKDKPVSYHYTSRAEYEAAGVRVRQRRVDWIETLARGVAYGHFCKFIVNTGSSQINFVGRQADAEIAKYMLLLFIRTAEELSEKAYVKYFYECKAAGDVTLAQGFKPSWLDGFAHRLMTRYYVETERVKTENKNNPGALVRLESSALAIKSFMDQSKLFKNAGMLGGNSNDNAEGHRQGREAANRQSLKVNQLPTSPTARRLA